MNPTFAGMSESIKLLPSGVAKQTQHHLLNPNNIQSKHVSNVIRANKETATSMEGHSKKSNLGATPQFEDAMAITPRNGTTEGELNGNTLNKNTTPRNDRMIFSPTTDSHLHVSEISTQSNTNTITTTTTTSSQPQNIRSNQPTSALTLSLNSNSLNNNNNISSLSRLTKRPVYKLTVGLLNVYRNVVQTYQEYRQKKARDIAIKGKKDDGGEYKPETGEIMKDRYVVLEFLGKGSYGVVVRAFDKERQNYVAIKVMRNRTPFFHQGLQEVRMLEHMMKYDPEDKHAFVKIKGAFMHKNSHLCIVFDLLAGSLYDLMRSTHFQGVSLNMVRKFGLQLLNTLRYMAHPMIDIVHCDIKPENILLVHPKRSLVKIIDFGSSYFQKNPTRFKYVQSRYYRSPEVILELDPYTKAVDMWSLGCTLAEMHVGEPLFLGNNEHEVMYKICMLIGVPPVHMIENSAKGRKFFYAEVDPVTKAKVYQVKKPKDAKPYLQRNLTQLIGVYEGGPNGRGSLLRRLGESGHTETDYLKFKDLIERMLCLDPAKRVTPEEALNHGFFASSQDEGTETEKSVQTVDSNNKDESVKHPT